MGEEKAGIEYTMDAIKVKLSIVLLTTVSPIIKSNSKKIEISTTKDLLFLLKDKNTNYDFFFRVESEELNGGIVAVNYTCKPFSTVENIAKGTKIDLKGFVSILIRWFENIEKYKTEQLIDDPIIKQYSDEFYHDYKIVDTDAETNTFNFPQQVLLLNYIEEIEAYIKEESATLSEKDKPELLKEANYLKECIYTETKDSYIKKQSAFWAKIRKKSIRVCEFAVEEFGKIVIKKLAEKGIPVLWHELPTYIAHFKLLING